MTTGKKDMGKPLLIPKQVYSDISPIKFVESQNT